LTFRGGSDRFDPVTTFRREARRGQELTTPAAPAPLRRRSKEAACSTFSTGAPSSAETGTREIPGTVPPHRLPFGLHRPMADLLSAP